MSCVSSLPARPTNGSPCRSSCSPGPSPTNSRSASARPTPNTTCVRPAASLHSVHVDAASAATSARRAPAQARDATRMRRGELERHGAPGDDTGRATADRCESAAATTSAAARPQAVEVHVDGSPVAQRDRQVAVETGVRRTERRAKPSCALCATRWQPSLSHATVGDDHDERRVRRPPRTVRVGEPGRAGRRRRSRDARAVVADDVADRVDDRERARRSRRRPRACAIPRPPGTAWSRPRHFPTVAPGSGADPPGFECVVALAATTAAA